MFDRRRRSRALARANEALANGELEEAQQLAEGVLREDSVNLDALLLLGELRLLEGDSDAALAVLERALSEDPENPTVRERLGDVHARRAADARELGNLEECVEAFNDALPYVSDKAFIYYNMGCAYADFHQEHAAEAVEMWRRAIAERPDYTEPHFDLGTALFHSDRFDEALEHLRVVVAQRGDWPAPHYLIGVILVKHGEIDAALQSLKVAVGVNPSWARTASQDDHLASLRGNPDFEALLESSTLIPIPTMKLDVLTPEEIFGDVDDDDDIEEPSDTDES